MFMVLCVLDDHAHLEDVLETLTKIGVSGVTIIDSMGSFRHLAKRVPLRYTFGDNSRIQEGNTTLFTIVPNEDMVKACLREIETVVGDLDGPNTGVFSAWPLAFTKGIPATRKE